MADARFALLSLRPRVSSGEGTLSAAVGLLPMAVAALLSSPNVTAAPSSSTLEPGTSPALPTSATSAIPARSAPPSPSPLGASTFGMVAVFAAPPSCSTVVLVGGGGGGGITAGTTLRRAAVTTAGAGVVAGARPASRANAAGVMVDRRRPTTVDARRRLAASRLAVATRSVVDTDAPVRCSAHASDSDMTDRVGDGGRVESGDARSPSSGVA